MQKHSYRLNGCYLLILFCIIFSLTGCTNQSNLHTSSSKSSSSVLPVPTDSLSVQYIDVGQGNAVLLQTKEQAMIIDGGDRSHSSKVVSYLKKHNVETLDYVIATHYDADHLSGLVGVLNCYPVAKVLDPDYTTDSKIFASYQTMKKEKGITSVHPKAGETYPFGDGQFTILAPNSTHYSDDNDYSIAILFEYGKNRFLFAGDASIESEYEILENGIDVSCDVYLASHHGSSTSTSEAFLKAMNPSTTIISVGADNSYGHPNEEILNRLKKASIPIYRTDTNGTITATSDGTTIQISTEHSSFAKNSVTLQSKPNSKESISKPDQKLIGNKNTKKVHRTSCSSLPDKDNQVTFSSYEESRKAGYLACKKCHPDS